MSPSVTERRFCGHSVDSKVAGVCAGRGAFGILGYWAIGLLKMLGNWAIGLLSGGCHSEESGVCWSVERTLAKAVECNVYQYRDWQLL